ncbi:unnamed protein product, partial [marine sediment metagenome]
MLQPRSPITQRKLVWDSNHVQGEHFALVSS